MKYINFNPTDAPDCVIRVFMKYTNKSGKEIIEKLSNISKKLNKSSYAEIEVFDVYLKELGFIKQEYNENKKIKEIIFNGINIVFCYDKGDIYHLTYIEDNIMYDKREDSKELFPISIYTK